MPENHRELQRTTEPSSLSTLVSSASIPTLLYPGVIIFLPTLVSSQPQANVLSAVSGLSMLGSATGQVPSTVQSAYSTHHHLLAGHVSQPIPLPPFSISQVIQ